MAKFIATKLLLVLVLVTMETSGQTCWNYSSIYKNNAITGNLFSPQQRAQCAQELVTVFEKCTAVQSETGIFVGYSDKQAAKCCLKWRQLHCWLVSASASSCGLLQVSAVDSSHLLHISEQCCPYSDSSLCALKVITSRALAALALCILVGILLCLALLSSPCQLNKNNFLWRLTFNSKPASPRQKTHFRREVSAPMPFNPSQQQSASKSKPGSSGEILNLEPFASLPTVSEKVGKADKASTGPVSYSSNGAFEADHFGSETVVVEMHSPVATDSLAREEEDNVELGRFLRNEWSRQRTVKRPKLPMVTDL